MAAWSGFSDEELRRMQQQKDQAMPAALGRGRRPAHTNRSRQQLQRERALQSATQQTAGSGSLPPEQQLIKPRVQPAPSQPAPNDTKEEKPKPSAPESVNHNHEPPPKNPPPKNPPLAAKELDKQEVELREKTRLEQLQLEQQMMEAKNKQKKALLAKTIAEKSKQTQAETVKLKRIQKELQALDYSVSNDIGILRKLIEQASLDYSIAWKRFEKAEAEYVAAKLDLHRKTEAKEQLTEHLCAIIQQNEQRKALKLEELMLQLELNTEEGAPDSQGTQEPGKQEGERAVQPAEENGPSLGTDAGAQGDLPALNQDCPLTEPKTSQENQDCKILDAPAVGVSEPPASAS